jgi:hypothetical protein
MSTQIEIFENWFIDYTKDVIDPDEYKEYIDSKLNFWVAWQAALAQQGEVVVESHPYEKEGAIGFADKDGTLIFFGKRPVSTKLFTYPQESQDARLVAMTAYADRLREALEQCVSAMEASNNISPFSFVNRAINFAKQSLATKPDMSIVEQKVPDGYSLVKTDVLNFLHGVGRLDGEDFNDVICCNEGIKIGKYWWRPILQKGTLPAAPKPAGKE